MRWWPWRRRRRDEADTAKVVRDAERSLREAERRGREVRHEMNVFAEQVEAALTKRRPR